MLFLAAVLAQVPLVVVVGCVVRVAGARHALRRRSVTDMNYLYYYTPL